MNTNFKNIIEFQRYFHNEEVCRNYLIDGRKGLFAPFACVKKYIGLVMAKGLNVLIGAVIKNLP